MQYAPAIWDCGGGKLWIDDVRLMEEPLVNMVRRPAGPLLVQDPDGQITYVEGRDFAELRDPQLGTTSWHRNGARKRSASPLTATRPGRSRA